MKKVFSLIVFILPLVVTAFGAERPNIVLILVDDMGFSDIGSYGGEIDTPNIDRMAEEGIKFSNFYNNSRCCPTRATLMTGLHAHQTGVGYMVGKRFNKSKLNNAYNGALNKSCATIAEALKPAGYATFMTGKWHLGQRDESMWPLQRGFDKFYGCLMGANNFFEPISPRHITYMNEQVEQVESTTERRWYATDAFTDYAIKFIEEEAQGEDRPFFLYLAYNAPHWPIQAHEEDIDKYRGKYAIGWDKVREERYKRQIESGLIDPSWPLTPRDSKAPAWDTIPDDKKEREDLRFAVYAAMIDCVDQNIGKLQKRLQDLGKAENTLFLFLTDNGASYEGPLLARPSMDTPEGRNSEQLTGANVGRAWANASNTPFRLYKHFTHEGGAATPFIMHWPKGIAPQKEWYRTPAHIMDIMPTLLELAGTDYPSTINGNPIPSLPGMSLAPSFQGKPLNRPTPIFNEHENNGLVIDGEWKLVGINVAENDGPNHQEWELYNLKTDRTEMDNIIKKHPEKAQEMASLWEEWANQVNVFPKPGKKKKEKK